MEKRQERMLEEVLKLPGNSELASATHRSFRQAASAASGKLTGLDACADCRALAPRWASVNLGIFLCVGCASIHRKMGTHTSRVYVCNPLLAHQMVLLPWGYTWAGD